jgi:hypothetical protein
MRNIDDKDVGSAIRDAFNADPATGESGLVNALEDLAREHGRVASAMSSTTRDNELVSIVDMLDASAHAQRRIADAICKPGVPYTDIDGGKVGDLTEAMIMCGKGLHSIAEAIEGLAEAARDRNEFLREQAEGEQ